MASKIEQNLGGHGPMARRQTWGALLSRASWSGWVVLGCLGGWLCACGDDGGSESSKTATMVQVALTEELQASTVAIVLETKGAEAYGQLGSADSRDDRLGGLKPADFPLSIAMQPRHEDGLRVFSLRAEALNEAGEAIAWGRVVSEYVAGEVGYVRLVLDSPCAEVSCAETQTCVQDGCVDAQLMPAATIEDARAVGEGDEPGGQGGQSGGGGTGGIAGTGGSVLPEQCAALTCVHGACAIDGASQEPLCVCQSGYTGDDCAEVVDSCAQLECQNGSACEQNGASAQCVCPEGYEGTECEHNPDDCAGVTSCKPGSCVDEVGGYRCACPEDYASLDAQACVAPSFRLAQRFATYLAVKVSLAEDGSGALVARDTLWVYRKGEGFEENLGPPLPAQPETERYSVRIAAINGHVVVAYASLVDANESYTGVVDVATGAWSGVRAQGAGNLVTLGSNHIDLVFANVQATGELQHWTKDGYLHNEEVPLTGPTPGYSSVTPDGRRAFVIEWHSNLLNHSWHTLVDGEVTQSDTLAQTSPPVGNGTMDLHSGNFGILPNGNWEFSFGPPAELRVAEGPYAGQPNGVDANGNIVTFAIDEERDSLLLSTYNAEDDVWTFHPPLARADLANLQGLAGVDLSDVGPWLDDEVVMDMAPNGNALLVWVAKSLSSDSLKYIHAVRYRRDAGLLDVHVLGSGYGTIGTKVDGVGHGLVHWRATTNADQTDLSTPEYQVVELY